MNKTKTTVNDYIKQIGTTYDYHLYDKWLIFAPKFDFKLKNNDWYDIFAYLLEGTFELNRINDDDVKDECIVSIPQCDCFYGNSLIADYTIPSINQILKENHINIKYKFNWQLKEVEKILA